MLQQGEGSEVGLQLREHHWAQENKPLGKGEPDTTRHLRPTEYLPECSKEALFTELW